jgi:hypothetical protein
MRPTIREQIIEQVDRLDDPQRRQVLDFARRLATPSGTPGTSLMHFIGSIDPTDLEVMSEAIQEGCEKVPKKRSQTKQPAMRAFAAHTPWQ